MLCAYATASTRIKATAQKKYCNTIAVIEKVFVTLPRQIKDMNRRNTKTKQMVMSVLQNNSSALCHEDIEQELAGKIDRVTIYRILNSFCDDGMVHKIPVNNGKTYFALCQRCMEHKHRDNHLHFKCLSCGKITCLDRTVEAPPLPDGYAFSSLLFTVSGQCSSCLKAENESIIR